MDERRRYFRIDDDFAVRYSPLPATTRDLRSLLRRGRSGHGNAKELRKLLARVRSVNPDVADVLHLFDERLANLETVHGAQDDERRDAQGVNISACGCAFPVAEELDPRTVLDMDLVLVPGELEMPVVGRVVDSLRQKHDPDYPWLARVDFVEINHDDHELLVQHVLQRQSRLIRAFREERAGPPGQAGL